MTETTRPNLMSFGENGSRIWYQAPGASHAIPLRRVRKVSVRMGDDAKVQGPFKLAATKIRVEQIHDSTTVSEQRFEDVRSPGTLLNVDGQISRSVHGTEIARSIVDKVTEKVVDKTTVDREIAALGLWSLALNRQASTVIYHNILVSDAIKRVLEAIDMPYGRIDETPNAMLRHFWVSDRQQAASVLAGLVEAAGPRARLDDHEGVITFSAEPAGVTRIIIYGGPEADGWDDASDTVTARTEEGVGPYSTTSAIPRYGVIPDWSLQDGFKHFQGEMLRERDSASGQISWSLQPNSEFEFNNDTFTIETVRSGYDSLRRRYYIEAGVTSSTMEGAFSQRTFRSHGEIIPMYFNWYINDKQFLRKVFTGSLLHTEWGTNTLRDEPLEDSTTQIDWQFSHGEIREGTVHVGWYRNEITKEDAEALGSFGFILTTDWDSIFELIEPASDSQRLFFSDWKRNDDDSRYFNSISVPSVTREFDDVDSDLWESPEIIEVVANASLTIRVSSTDGTPFKLADDAFTHKATDALASIEADKQSGAEVFITITAGSSDLALEDLVVRGRFFVPTLERQVEKTEGTAVDEDGEIEWVSAGDFPEGLNTFYLRSWIDARLHLGLERRWTTTIEIPAWDSGEDDYLRNNWQTMMRLRPGRLVQFIHGRDVWFGIIREISRESGSMMDHVDRYSLTCELTGSDAYDPDVFRLGLSTYGSDQVLG